MHFLQALAYDTGLQIRDFTRTDVYSNRSSARSAYCVCIQACVNAAHTVMRMQYYRLDNYRICLPRPGDHQSNILSL